MAPATARISGLAHVFVMYTAGCQSVRTASWFAISVMNVGHWAPSGVAMITSGAASAIAATWACGGASSPFSTVCSSMISSPAASAASLNASMYTLPNSLLT